MLYKWQKYLAIFFIILGVVVVGGGVLIQTRRLTQSQDTRSEATTEPMVDVSWSDLASKVEKGKSTTLDLRVNTKSYQLSGLELRGTIVGLPASEVKFETISVPGLVTVIQQFKAENDQVRFQLVLFSDVNQVSLFGSNNGTLTVGRLVFSPAQNRSVEVSFDSAKSDVSSYTTPTLALNFLNGGKRSTTFELVDGSQGDGKKGCNLNCATDTECTSQYICFQGRCRDPKQTADEKCGSKPDLGLQRQCNQYCADSRECAAGFTCWYNFCRNPKNLENTSCQNPPSPRPRSASTGTGGARPTPSPSPLVATITNVTTRPLPSTVSATVNVSTVSATLSGRVTTPSPKASPSMAPQPSIVPLPEELQPGADQPSIWSRIWQVALMLLLMLLIGTGIWWWRQNRAPRPPRHDQVI